MYVTASCLNIRFWVIPSQVPHSFASLYGETGAVRVKSQEWALEIKRPPVHSFAEIESPLIRKVRE